MSFSFIRTLGFATVVAFAPTFLFAQEVFGTIEASLDDEPRIWFLTAKDNDSQSFGMTVAVANLQSFTLWGQATEENGKSVDDSLLLKFDVMSVGDQMIPINVSVTHFEDGWKTGWLANEESGVVFSLIKLEKSEAGVFVEGSFDAAAGFSDSLASGQADAMRTMHITGRFSATLPASILQER